MWPFTSSQPAIGRDVKSLYDTYDYIIIGGGTAGCVLARRLSDYEGHTVLLVEKGDARDSWLDRIPLFSSHHFGDKKHSTVIQVHDEHVERTVDVIAGLGLGGSTRVNGCQFTCGVPGEYNAWAQAGNEGWSYDDIKPYLKKFETWHGPVTREYHGTDGPLQVRSFEGYAYSTAGKMQQAAEHIGFHRIEDLHSPFEPSFGVNKVPYTIGPDGTRQSAARAYLPTHLVQERSSRLHICTHAIGARVLLSSNEDGTTKADHVLVQSVTSEEKRMISAKREIVLTCGTLVTPQVLMLSGIGPAAHLREMAIDPIVDLPGVGEHLQDHLYLPTSYNCPLPDSLWGAFRWPPTLIREIYRYVRYGSGYLLGTLCESEVLGISSLVGDDGIPLPHTKERESSADPANLPDFALLSTGIADPSSPGMDRSQGTYAILCALLRPKSLGRVRLSSSNARDQPKIDLRYLSDASDYAPLRAALRVSLALGRTMREDGYPLRPVLAPSSSSDAELDAFIRKHSTSMSHFTSTCRMAPDGVVDERLRVRGVSGLRIADASVIPQATAAVHPQSLVYVIAEKCADMVLKDAA